MLCECIHIFLEVCMRGPKPKPQGNCLSCEKLCKLTRGFCNACYVRKLRNGEIERLEKKHVPSFFSELQESYLLGSLLGDGCIYKHKSTHLPYFAVQRKYEDLEYNLWEKNIMEPFVCKFFDGETFDKRTGKTYKWAKFRTHRCINFVEYYDKWYSKGFKLIPKDINLNPLSLAIWFADDGYVREQTPGRIQLKLSTHGFDVDSVEFISNLLSKRYGEYFGITLEYGKKPIIYASDSGSRKFCEEIDPVIPMAISRKAIWRNVQYKLLSNKNCNHLRKTKNGLREIN